MKTKWEQFLEEKGITKEQFAELEADKMAENTAEFQAKTIDEIQSAIQNKASKEDVTEMIKGLATSEELKGLNEILKTQGLTLQTLKAKGTAKENDTIVDSVKENFETIKSIAQSKSNKEVVIKASTTRASIANNEQAFDLPDIGQLATRKLSMYDIFPKLEVSNGNHNGTIRYYDWDEDTIARAAAMVAEGAAFPESKAKFKKGTISLQKVGDTLPVTEEFMEDETMFAAELEMFLTTNVALKVDEQLSNGDGTGNNLKGLLASIDAYVPTGQGIPDANIFDLAVKVSEDITTIGGAKYMPDVLIARRSVINRMKLKKDGDNNYILPPFVDANGNNVDGMVVIESNIFPDNTLVIGDRRFGRIYQMGGVEVSRGTINSQFTEDEMTLKARKRLAFLIREADKGGFRKVTDIDAALVTIQGASA